MNSLGNEESRSHSAVKLSIAGAGRAVFSLQIVRDLCTTLSPSGSEIVLMNINVDRLDAVAALATCWADETSSNVSFVATHPEVERDRRCGIDHER